MNLGNGHFGKLRFVSIECGHGFWHGTVGTNVAKGVNHVLRAGKGRRTNDVVFTYAESRREIAPQLRMRALRIFLFREDFEHDRLERNVKAASQYAPMVL